MKGSLTQWRAFVRANRTQAEAGPLEFVAGNRNVFASASEELLLEACRELDRMEGHENDWGAWTEYAIRLLYCGRNRSQNVIAALLGVQKKTLASWLRDRSVTRASSVLLPSEVMRKDAAELEIRRRYVMRENAELDAERIASLERSASFAEELRDIALPAMLEALSDSGPPPEYRGDGGFVGGTAALFLSDFHAGKEAYGWNIDAEWDVIAQTIGLAARAKGMGYGEIALFGGNDWFQVNGLSGTTAKGTPVEHRGNIRGQLRDGFRMWIRLVKRLAEMFQTVRPAVVESNHCSSIDIMTQLATEVIADYIPGVEAMKPQAFGLERDHFILRGEGWNQLALHGHQTQTRGDLSRGVEAIIDEWLELDPLTRGAFNYIVRGHHHQHHEFEHRGVRVHTNVAACPPDEWIKRELGKISSRGVTLYGYRDKEGLTEKLWRNFPRIPR